MWRRSYSSNGFSATNSHSLCWWFNFMLNRLPISINEIRNNRTRAHTDCHYRLPSSCEQILYNLLNGVPFYFVRIRRQPEQHPHAFHASCPTPNLIQYDFMGREPYQIDEFTIKYNWQLRCMGGLSFCLMRPTRWNHWCGTRTHWQNFRSPPTELRWAKTKSIYKKYV